MKSIVSHSYEERSLTVRATFVSVAIYEELMTGDNMTQHKIPLNRV